MEVAEPPLSLPCGLAVVGIPNFCPKSLMAGVKEDFKKPMDFSFAPLNLFIAADIATPCNPGKPACPRL